MTTDEQALEGATPQARNVAAGEPARSAEEMIARLWAALPTLTEAEKIATLNAHPRIGERPDRMSARSLQEQGDDVPPQLDPLNAGYARKLGLPFVVYVNRPPKSEI